MTADGMSCGVIRWAALGLALAACDGSVSGGPTGPGDGGGGTGGAQAPAVVTSGYVTSAFGFFYPDSLESTFPGFNLDGRVSRSASPAPDECAHDDFVGPGAEEGIDYNLLRIIFDEEKKDDGEYVFGGFRQGQLVDGVINGAVKNGSMTILLDIQGVDDPQNDGEVTVQMFGSDDSPVKGTDESVLPYATLSVHPDPRYHTAVFTGSIVDGILTAGPFDLILPINIQIVQDEFVVHGSWLRLELGDDSFEGLIAGYWDVSNIRDIVGKPTTDNGNAANFTIEQFDAAMALHADGDYDPSARVCTSLTTMFTFGGVQAFIARAGGDSGEGGSGGSGGPVDTPVDQCVGADDQAALEAIGGVGAIGPVASECPTTSCAPELTDVLTSGGSDGARIALGDCIAQCISDATGLSRMCTDCYGAIASCSVSYCLQPCAADSGSPECAECALEHCADLNACTGL